MIERGHSIGEKNGMYGKTHTPEAIKKIMTKRPMNKLEKRVADLLDEHNIDYHYQFFLNRDGVCKSYDFKIKGQPIILEIDGDYWHGGPKAEKYTPFFDLESNMENDKFKNKFAEEHGFKVLRF
jgi:very-short-patch-repair endonuclease